MKRIATILGIAILLIASHWLLWVHGMNRGIITMAKTESALRLQSEMAICRHLLTNNVTKATQFAYVMLSSDIWQLQATATNKNEWFREMTEMINLMEYDFEIFTEVNIPEAKRIRDETKAAISQSRSRGTKK
jgi:hypothetical protein